MAKKLFGTDGVRGRANTQPIEAEMLLKLAKATCLKYATKGEGRHKVVIGKDTRLSGYMVEPALTAGFISMGWDVVILGPVPTPAVSVFTRSLRADLGVMISASHNPYEDNGVKFFTADGYKLSDEDERDIERIIEGDLISILPPSEKLGRASRLDDAVGRYVEFSKGTLPRHLRLDGLKIVVDCANGAAYKAAPQILWELGAEVITIGDEPDGTNINEACGATHPELLAQTVLENEADIGLALDGDADRIIVVDEKGNIIDGDQVIGLIAISMKEAGTLKNNAAVATVMSNMGLEECLKKSGITLHKCAVGDRYVIEMMRDKGCNLGGEQSGHVILNEFATTGDGLVSALQILSVLKQKGVKASKLLDVFKPFPQLLKNVKVKDKSIVQNKQLQDLVLKKETELEGEGRILLRPSGTESLIRVMAEGKDYARIEKIVDELCQFIAKIEEENLNKNVA